MRRFRMKKEKIVKPDGRWMYLYTFEEVTEQPSEEVTEQPSSDRKEEPDAQAVQLGLIDDH
ncbi:MAG: hypothetical protein ACUVTY_08180 [Armatimonadota bacterium]